MCLCACACACACARACACAYACAARSCRAGRDGRVRAWVRGGCSRGRAVWTPGGGRGVGQQRHGRRTGIEVPALRGANARGPGGRIRTKQTICEQAPTCRGLCTNLLRGLVVARVFVGVVFHGFLPVGLFDFRRRRPGGHPEQVCTRKSRARAHGVVSAVHTRRSLGVGAPEPASTRRQRLSPAQYAHAGEQVGGFCVASP